MINKNEKSLWEKAQIYGSLEIYAKQLVEGFITGLHKSPFHGFSVEFAEHKLYNSGESTRHIDWKVFAKTDKLFVKRYEEETNLRCHLLLDTSASMLYPVETKSKLVFSALGAGALAYLLQKQRDAVGLTLFSDGIDLQLPAKSTGGHLHQIFQELEKCVATSNQRSTSTNLVETLHNMAETMPKRSMVILFSDMFERIENLQLLFGALQHIRHKKHEVILFHVTDKSTELHFDFEDRPYEFIDLETGDKVKAHPKQVKELYREKMQFFYNELKIKCGQYKIDYTEVDVKNGFDAVFMAFMAKRARIVS
ncbi:MAG: DUF58 domain-containing protein [Spirosomataceae bacterium]